MKNQYFGDINDYLKYGLLRAFSETGWRIGVCWMLTPDDCGTDGRKTAYLSRPKVWRGYDPVLFDRLNSAVVAGCRNIDQVASDPGLIPGAQFYSELIPDAAAAREAWFHDVLTGLRGSDLLFFDPDNGMEIASATFGKKRSSKFLYWREVSLAWKRGVSILIFQHFPRVTRAEYISNLAGKLQQEAPGGLVVSLQTLNVLYLLAVAPQHRTRMRTTLDLATSRWGSRVR